MVIGSWWDKLLMRIQCKCDLIMHIKRTNSKNDCKINYLEFSWKPLVYEYFLFIILLVYAKKVEYFLLENT